MITMPFTDMEEVYRHIQEYESRENHTEAESKMYQRELKAFRDYYNKFMTSIEIGFAEGLSKRLAESTPENRPIVRFNILVTMAEYGFKSDKISEVTGLPIEKVNEIMKYIDNKGSKVKEFEKHFMNWKYTDSESESL